MAFRALTGLFIGLGLLAGTAAPAAVPRYTLQITPAKEIEATYTVSVRMPEYAVKEWRFISAQPPELPCQTKVQTDAEPEAASEAEGSRWERPLLVVTVADPEREKDVKIQVTYKATLMARRLVPLSPRVRRRPVPPLSTDEREMAMESTAMFDFKEPAFQQWLTANGLRRTPREADVDFARRVFLTIRQTCDYDYSRGLDRRASAVCASRQSDCAGLCVLFVSALRANDIPARTLAGRLARTVDPEEKLHGRSFQGQHVRAEFYAEGIGWVPADPTRSLNDKSRHGLTHFGADPGDLFVLHVNADLVIHPWPGRDKTVHWLQAMPYFFKGRGSTEGREEKYDWQVRVLREAQQPRSR